MTQELKRFAVSLSKDLFERFDKVIQKHKYTNRSEAVRDLIRASLADEEWADNNNDVIGTVLLVYDHHTGRLISKLQDIQHDYHEIILSVQHFHLDHYNCLEIVVVKGKSRTVKDVADKLISINGIKFGKLTAATTGVGIS